MNWYLLNPANLSDISTKLSVKKTAFSDLISVPINAYFLANGLTLNEKGCLYIQLIHALDKCELPGTVYMYIMYICILCTYVYV